MSQLRFNELIAKEMMETLSVSEATELAQFLNDDKYKEQYDLYKMYFSTNTSVHDSDLAIFNKVMTKIGQDETLTSTPSFLKRHYPLVMSVASIAALILVVLFIFTKQHSGVDIPLVTKAGSKRSITLSDGTKVILNGSSKLVYPAQFGRNSREVTLVGEAFFDVVKNPDRPFIIHTEKMNIKVLGTAFNVKSYPNDPYSETTLIRGLVEVTIPNRGNDKITLRPSEKLKVNFTLDEGSENAKGGADDLPLTELTHYHKNDSTLIETSWLNNTIAFKDETFFEIAKSLERAYGVKISFGDENLKKLKFTGTFERRSPLEILKALSVTENFTYTADGNNLLIK
ncbi:ferric-dicitrate binding protein FerR (iron transport regulator) [Pedobacter sp. CAN_A7]|uniref:FecR family protein n=1 Tax=Pedobacter sp. CAN_A7 TaxID=2787722 RepID=UPI0018CACF22